MKRVPFILILLFLWELLLLPGCRKKEYPPSVVENEPAYYAEVTVDGNKTQLQAGVNNYYMYGSNQLDSEQVYNYLSRLRSSDCSNCPALSIQINNFAANAGFRADSSLKPGPYKYLPPFTTAPVITTLTGLYSSGAADSEYQWDFGDGTKGTGRVVTHIYDNTGKRTICLKVTGSNKCMSMNCNEFTLSDTAASLYITSISTNTRSASFMPHYTGGTAPYSFSWDFGDGTTSLLENPSHTFPYQGAYAVTLSMRDAKGGTVISRYNYKTLNDNSSCTTNMLVSAGYNNFALLSTSRVLVSWTDDKGLKYQSDKVAQGSDSYFEILSSEDAGTNENGEKVRKLKVKFAAMLSDGSKTINLANGNAVIAVTYK